MTPTTSMTPTTPGKVLFSLAAPLLMGFLTSCSLVVDPDRLQCEQDLDCGGFAVSETETFRCIENYCVASECGADGDCPIGQTCSEVGQCEGGVLENWTCLDEDLSGGEDTVTMVLPIVNPLSRQLVTGTKVRVCRLLDDPCTEDNATLELESTASGVVSIEVPANFKGYVSVVEEGLELKDDGERVAGGPYFPLLYFLPSPPIANAVLNTMFQIPASQVNLVLGDEAELLESRGHIVITAIDCAGMRASGIRFQSSSEDNLSSAFYSVGRPSFELNETQESYGSGGFVNFPIKTTELQSRLADTGQVIGTTDVIIREGTISQAYFMRSAEAK